jgi:hypothetical protein
VDGTARWNYFIRRLTEFIAALPLQDRRRIRLQSVTHRDNIADMSDFVRLTSRIGAAEAVFYPIHVREPEKLNLSLYWFKDQYNDAVEAACVVGCQLGVSVAAVRFFTSTKMEHVNLDEVCHEPLDTAYVSKGELAAPCCHWTDTHIPCDVYSDSDGFDRFWNHEIFQRLRRKRDFRSCQVCEFTRIFDEVGSHLAPLLRRRLDETGRAAELDARDYSSYAGLVRAAQKERLDLPSLRRTLLQLDLATEALGAIETDGAAALPTLDRLAWEAFSRSDAPALQSVDLPLAGNIAGIGWGLPIYEPENRTSGRCLGGTQQASVLVRVRGGRTYEVRFVGHRIGLARLARLKVAVGAEPLETMVGIDKGGKITLSCVIPRRLVDAHDGRLWLRVGCIDAATPPTGNISFSRLVIEENQMRRLRSLAQRARLARHVATYASLHGIASFMRAAIWRPLAKRHPALAAHIIKTATSSPIGNVLKRWVALTR